MSSQPEPFTLSKNDLRLAEWLAMLAFAVYAYFYAGAGWNQNAQFDLTRAIVERHSFSIDEYAGNTGDVSHYGGRAYSNKPPGLSLLGVIPYSGIYAVERAYGIDPSRGRVLAVNNYLCSLSVVGLLGALIPAMLYVEGRRRGFPARWCALVAVCVAFGTQLFPYSTLFVAQVPSGALLLAAFSSRRRAWSGFCAGAATLVNYLCAPAVIMLAVIRRPRDAARFLAGSIPPIILLTIYQHICFGSLISTSIDRLDERFVTKGSAMGVFGRPSLDAFYGITLSPYRGLFFFAPILLLSFAGAIVWFRRRESLPQLAAIAVLTAIFFAVNVSFNGWEGGFGIGARYLVPLIPLFGLTLLYCGGKLRWLFGTLAVVSLAINFTATAVDPQPSGTIPRPLTQYLIPLLVSGHFGDDIPITRPWSAETFTGHTSVNRLAHDEAVVFTRHPPGSPAAEWSSFNLGEPLFGAGELSSLLPIVLILAIGIAAVLRLARRVQSE